ncbi:hypothetical protein KUCAC02_003524 [Chaenocephalus aceratus]|uniref:Uncharacterized protein n=1 Tax=Chaenocephalus aceratus TaxID=36190 RepID=A0ACB9WKT8_CHAAC|nr:hypothetical protein KUCAC02_003524 [Chaenocephalus aceratus]
MEDVVDIRIEYEPTQSPDDAKITPKRRTGGQGNAEGEATTDENATDDRPQLPSPARLLHVGSEFTEWDSHQQPGPRGENLGACCRHSEVCGFFRCL